MARRVPIPIFIDSESQQSASEECLVVCVERKSVGRRRSSSLDTGNENAKHRNRKSVAEKMHHERMVCHSLSGFDI